MHNIILSKHMYILKKILGNKNLLNYMIAKYMYKNNIWMCKCTSVAMSKLHFSHTASIIIIPHEFKVHTFKF